MSKHRVQFILLIVTFTLSGSASVLCAQEDFKGSRRAPNPPVYHRTGARQPHMPTINERVETALEQGNRARDKANTVGTSDDLDVAEKFYKKALALNPKEARAYVGLGNVEMDYDYIPSAQDAWHEGMKRAEGYYRQALELNPKYYDAYMGLAHIHYINSSDPSSYAKSEQEYRQAMSLRPRDPEPHSSLGLLYEVMKDYSKAAAAYREALNLATDKETLLGLYLSLGGVLEKQEQYAEATDVYRKMIKLDPKDGVAHLALGEVYLNQQKYAEAVEELTLAVKLNPDASAAPPLLYDAYYKLGLSYVAAKNKAAAMEQYQNLRKAGQTGYAERLLAEINKQ